MRKSKRKIRRGGLAPDKYLSEKQIERLLCYLHDRKLSGSQRAAINEFIVIMLLYSGLRAEELLALRLEDLPCYHGKDVIEVIDGKGDIDRAVEIPDWLSNRIDEFVKDYRRGAKPGSVLIPSEAGFRRVNIRKIRRVNGRCFEQSNIERSCRMIYHSLYNKLRRIGIQAGIGKLHPHMLRHTFLTRLYNVQQDLRFVQDQAGHYDPKTTAIYAQTANRLRRQQVQSLRLPSFS